MRAAKDESRRIATSQDVESTMTRIEKHRQTVQTRHQQEQAAIIEALSRKSMTKRALSIELNHLGIGSDRLGTILKSLGDKIYIEHMQGDGKMRTPAYRYGTPPAGYSPPKLPDRSQQRARTTATVERRKRASAQPSYAADPMMGMFFSKPRSDNSSSQS